MRAGVLLVWLGLMAAAAHAGQFTGKVIAVFDGDTVMMTRGSGPPVKVRLAEIDAPEKAQQGGMESKQSLSDLVLHKRVKVNTLAVDSYGRLVAHLAVDGTSVNEEQVRRGMAWEYSHYHRNKNYIALQRAAQQARRGLWAQTNPLPPWEWRKRHTTDNTVGHSTRLTNNSRPGAGHGAASHGRELPVAHAAIAPAKTRHAKKPVRVTGDYTCGSKTHCSQMLTCDEANFYLSYCGVKSLDRNHDGVPCDKLCGGRK